MEIRLHSKAPALDLLDVRRRDGSQNVLLLRYQVLR
jgi:hypothetical protein